MPISRVWPLLLFLTSAPEKSATPGFADGDVLPHDLLVLPGENAPGKDVELRVRDELHRFPVREGHFKAICLLKPGENQLTLRSGSILRELRLEYRPPEQERAVRFVYALAADGEGGFDAPPDENHHVASALRRVAVGARVMKSFTAEGPRTSAGAVNFKKQAVFPERQVTYRDKSHKRQWYRHIATAHFICQSSPSHRHRQ